MFRQAIFAATNPHSLNWTVEQTWRKAGAWFRWIRSQILPKEAVAYCSISDLRIELINGATWEFRSAENYDSLRGEGLHSLVGHETAFWNERAWHALRPMLSDMRGWAAMASTPQGLKNWFTKEWKFANQWQGSDWEGSRRAFLWPTSINPIILQVEIEDARRTLPDATFRQEYLGEFISDSGSLFHFAEPTWTGKFELPQEGGRYVAGYDLAKRRDYTAWAILRVDTMPWRVVDFGRMQQVDYSSQLGILATKFKQYKVLLALADQYQEAVTEQLRERGVEVRSYPLSQTSRATLLANLAVEGEQNRLRIPGKDAARQRDIDVLRGEIENFTPNVSRLGSVRYEAAHGYHDDYVFALAMAVEAGKRYVPSGSKDTFAYLSIGGRGKRF